MRRSDHILTTASNLLGITLLIIAGLHISNRAAKTLADEVAWGGAIAFVLSCVLSYVDLRTRAESGRAERFADRFFMLGLGLLFVSIVVLALSDA